MLLQTWQEVFTRAFQDIGAGIIGYTPKLFVAIVIFVLGWMFGAILGRIISQVIKTIKVDNALREAGLEEVFSKAGLNLEKINRAGEEGWELVSTVPFTVANGDVTGAFFLLKREKLED